MVSHCFLAIWLIKPALFSDFIENKQPFPIVSKIEKVARNLYFQGSFEREREGLFYFLFLFGFDNLKITSEGENLKRARFFVVF